MNKYQKSLDRIKMNYPIMLMSNPPKEAEEIQVLQELVELATPMKPTETHCSYNCPTCGSIQTMKYEGMCIECQNEYCGKCGQKLDWSEK